MTGSLYAPPAMRRGDTICLPPDEAHHLLHVKRLRPREEVIVVDGEGGWYRVVARGASAREADVSPRSLPGSPCRELGRGHLALVILEERREVGEPPWHLTLAQAVGKGRKFELVLEKGTELGISSFIPLSTDRDIVHWRSPEGVTRHDRWRRIALAAMKQCGRSRLPRVESPRGLRGISSQLFPHFDAVLIATLAEESVTVREALSGAGLSPGSRARVLALVGSEGGFTEAELRAALEAGAVMVTLGARRLRTETAGIALAALVGAALDPES